MDAEDIKILSDEVKRLCGVADAIAELAGILDLGGSRADRVDVDDVVAAVRKLSDERDSLLERLGRAEESISDLESEITEARTCAEH